MKGKLLKKINQTMPDSIKKFFRKQIRAKVINNSIFKETKNEIKSFNDLSEEEKNKYHLKKLKETLIYAYENTIFYKKTFDKVGFNPYNFSDIKEMDKIPTINKELILEHFDEFLSKENIDYYEAFTGGSTGKPLKIFLDTNSIYKEKAFVYNYWSKFGYDYKNSKIVTFRGLEFGNKIYKYNPIDNQVIVNPFKLSDENIDKYIKIINDFNPEFFHGYVSAINNFCKLLSKNNIKLKANIKCVFFISENVTCEEKKYIEEVLNCKTNIFYGHSERAVFAEYFNGSYEFNKLYTHVDFLKKKDTENLYEIACTGLLNKKMIFIKYIPDDVVEIINNKINIYGHWDKELLIGKNNENISIASINFHNNVFSKVKFYQFEQFERGKVVLNIVEDSKLTENDKKEILEILNKKIKDCIDVKIKVVESIELTKRGKYKKVIKHFK